MKQLKELAGKNKLVTAIVLAVLAGLGAYFFGIESTINTLDDTVGDGGEHGAEQTVEAPNDVERVE